MLFFVFLYISPGSAEAGGKINYLFIAYFRGNSFAKNCQNRFMFVRVIVKQNSDIFAAQHVVTFC